jgi:hypothetical protein
MKSFEEFKKNKNLILFADISKLGTMYFVPDLPVEKDYIIRHLDAELTEELLPSYVELYNSVKHWIESNSKIDEYICMPNLTEVGKDYIIRPFRVYIKSVRSYFDEEEPIEPPKRYFEMIKVFSEEMIRVFDEQEGINFTNKNTIIKRVLRKSVFGLSGKTVFEYRSNKFELVEPKISIEDIEEWWKY